MTKTVDIEAVSDQVKKAGVQAGRIIKPTGTHTHTHTHTHAERKTETEMKTFDYLSS